jgi:hypothetical protein
MNVNIKTEVTETTRISNDNCTVVLVNGDISSIKVNGIPFAGEIEFQKNFEQFEKFVENCVDVYHSVRLEQVDKRSTNT